MLKISNEITSVEIDGTQRKHVSSTVGLNLKICFCRLKKAILAKGRFRADVFKISFFNRIVDLWNGLPVAIRNEQFSNYHRFVRK